MLLNRVFNIVKNISLSALLLMPSIIAQAQAEDTAALSTQAADISANEDRQRGFNFPRWPESRRVVSERVPHAPPGPYMSSALSDFSFERPSYARDFSRPEMPADSAGTQIDKFSPDVAWPGQAKSPVRWQPENGYRFVDPGVEWESSHTRPYNSSTSPSYNHGYNRRSPDTWQGRPDRDFGRHDPVMNDMTR